MNRAVCWCVLIVICIQSLLFVTAVYKPETSNEALNGESAGMYFNEEDFQSIIVGKSTYRDVCNIALPSSVQLTSYGGFCEFPQQDGTCIRIKFYGKEMIVGAIEKTERTD